MSSHLMIDMSMDEERMQLLRSKQAQIEQLEAEIKSLRSTPLSKSPSSSSQHGRVHKQQHRRSMSRSTSSNGAAPMARHLSSDRVDLPQQRTRNFSQRSATPMARTNSKNSTSQRGGNLPFAKNGAMPPPIFCEPRREDPAIISWTQQEPPLSTYTLSHQPIQQRPMPQRGSGLEQVRELEDLADPCDFLRDLGVPFATPSPSISIPSPSTMSSHRLSSSFGSMPPLTPTSDMLTCATTFTDSMSRQDSLCNERFLDSMQRMKVYSNPSYSPEVSYDHTLYGQVSEFSSLHTRRSSNEEQSKLLVGAGGASHDESQFSHTSFPLPSSGSCGEKMEKSQSIESTSSSSSSSSSRNVKRLHDQIRLAARPLMPAGGSVSNAMSRENSSQSMARGESRDGSTDNKVAISKPTYQRPKHDRVYCEKCDSHQEGFRGQHELSRHMDREHRPTVKKWMCVEPQEGVHTTKPVLPLSKCKACAQQKKKYGAYYNAAAHLRRAHFKPKSKGRGKSSKIDDAEKRGGKGGGDWPHMSELKYWMKEVEERVDTSSNDQTVSTVADSSDAEDEDANENSVDEQTYSQQPISMTANTSFDNAYIDDTPILNPTPFATNNELFGMQGMQLHIAGATHQNQCGMEQTMFANSSVSNNFSLSLDPYQNQQMFYDNPSFLATQNTEDQILAGPDFVNHYY